MVEFDRLVDEIEPDGTADRFRLAANERVGKLRRCEQGARKHRCVGYGRPRPRVSEGAGEGHSLGPKAHVMRDLDRLLLLQVRGAIDGEDGPVAEPGETE